MTEITPDVSWMEYALAEAENARSLGEVPVGAVVVASDGKTLLGKGHNRTRTDNDPTAHAEVISLRNAAKNLGFARLDGCSLYVTLEPCPMCAGAIAHARIAQIFYGAYDPQYGAIDHGIKLFQRAGINHRPAVIGGIAEEACRHMLRDFFNERR